MSRRLNGYKRPQTISQTTQLFEQFFQTMNGATTPNRLTCKFSRNSLRAATGHASAKVHSRQEELARATNKRFNSDSWRKVSRSYRTLPNAPTTETNSTINSLSNTQILCALSSLTEDQAFQTGTSNIPLRTSSSFTASSYSTPRDSQSTSRSPLAIPPQVTNESPALDISNVLPNETKQEETAKPGPLVASTKVLRSPTTPSLAAKPSLRTAAGRIPKLSRRSFVRRMPPTNQSQNYKDDDGATNASVSPQARSGRTQSSSFLSIQSLFFVFMKFLKLLHQLLMLPETLRRFLTRPCWSGKGKHILITGASSGIGAEIARQYAAQGATLALFARTTEDLEIVARECREFGCHKVHFYACDLSNPVSTKLAMKQALVDFGRFDVVVLNAGRTQGCFFEEIKDPSQIENMIKLNVNGAITSLHYVLPKVPKTSDSRIVVISNTAGIVAAPYQSVFSATKHALTGFSNALRIELKNTYGRDSPRVCLVSLPEVSGTRLNAGRMDMGAKLPPTKWYSWAGMPLPQAVRALLPAIAAGKREFGQPRRFDFWRSLYPLCPEWVDFWMMKHIQKTHFRPLDERKHPTMQETNKTPRNKSWAY